MCGMRRARFDNARRTVFGVAGVRLKGTEAVNSNLKSGFVLSTSGH